MLHLATLFNTGNKILLLLHDHPCEIQDFMPGVF
jgi:hypothetical protein